MANFHDAAPKEFEEKLVQLDRVARVVAGGRRFRFRATVVIGDKKGKVGVGVAKGREVQVAIQKAVYKAKKDMLTVPLEGSSIPMQVQVTFNGATVMLKPARVGTGVIAGGPVRAVVESAGIKDVLSKMIGSSNKVNNVYATFEALKKISRLVEQKKAKAVAK